MTADWVTWGTKLLLATMDELDDDQLEGPSLLPDWSRRYLLAHVAANADALQRLLHWARTGEPTPMYASAADREAGIAAGAALPVDEIRARVRDTAEDLLAGFDAMPADAWPAEVKTAQGRAVQALVVPWMRTREVMIHTVDLNAGVTFADLPDEVCAALVDDITSWRNDQGPAMTLSDGARRWTVTGAGDPLTITCPVDVLAAWLTGRPAPAGLPGLPRWL